MAIRIELDSLEYLTTTPEIPTIKESTVIDRASTCEDGIGAKKTAKMQSASITGIRVLIFPANFISDRISTIPTMHGIIPGIISEAKRIILLS